MRINVYPKHSEHTIRERKFVKNIIEARSFCDWYRKTHGQEVEFVICG